MNILKTAALAGLVTLGAGTAAIAEVGPDGLHMQPFFANTFLDMSEDLSEATANGKDLMVIVEQNGCPYCAEMHNVNFERDEIVSYVEDNFLVIQLDMWGSREVTGFDGETLEEKDLVRKWSVNFTPTTLLFTAPEAGSPPDDMQEALAFAMPGYFKPFHHLSALQYVASDGYKEQPNFQRWLQAKADAMREDGEEVTIWE
jgi:thioredoxin-related protein